MQWYENPDWNNYRVKYDFTPFPVNGDDIAMQQGTEITAAFSGFISNILYDESGGILIIKISNTGESRGLQYFWYDHLDAIDPALMPGSPVTVGQFIGYSGGENYSSFVTYPNGWPTHPSSTRTSNGDHIMIGFSHNNSIPYGTELTDELNPHWVLDYLKGVKPPTQYIRASSFRNPLDLRGSLPQIKLPENANISNVLVAMDEKLSLINPFDVNVQQSSFGPIKIGNAVQYIGDVGNGFVSDFAALVVRGVFIILGILIFYMIANEAFDINQKIGEVTGEVKNVASQAAILAM